MNRRSVLLVLTLLMGACGGDDDGDDGDSSSGLNPQESCEALVEVLCAKTFECSEEELGFTEAECVEEAVQESGCATRTEEETCEEEGGEYQPGRVGACLRSLEELDCDTFANDENALDTPECERVCG